MTRDLLQQAATCGRRLLRPLGSRRLPAAASERNDAHVQPGESPEHRHQPQPRKECLLLVADPTGPH